MPVEGALHPTLSPPPLLQLRCHKLAPGWTSISPGSESTRRGPPRDRGPPVLCGCVQEKDGRSWSLAEPSPSKQPSPVHTRGYKRPSRSLAHPVCGRSSSTLLSWRPERFGCCCWSWPWGPLAGLKSTSACVSITLAPWWRGGGARQGEACRPGALPWAGEWGEHTPLLHVEAGPPLVRRSPLLAAALRRGSYCPRVTVGEAEAQRVGIPKAASLPGRGRPGVHPGSPRGGCALCAPRRHTDAVKRRRQSGRDTPRRASSPRVATSVPLQQAQGQVRGHRVWLRQVPAQRGRRQQLPRWAAHQGAGQLLL